MLSPAGWLIAGAAVSSMSRALVLRVEPFMSFTKLGLSNPLIEGVKAMGFLEPTPIQLRAIPLILQGQDVIGSAQTGTGKTAAFALPILSRLGQHGRQT